MTSLAPANGRVRHDWTKEDISDLYHSPLLELIYQAATIHRRYHDPTEVQVCTLLSIKTGACPEDCAYCPQSARYQTAVASHTLLPVEDVLSAAEKAKTAGASRFCLGAAFRQVKNNQAFADILKMVAGVNDLGLEVCCTLGMLTEDQAVRLKEAGLYAYNHNLDTSREFYSEVITTRTYDDRLQTLQHVRNANITVCCGGIIGMGESDADRIGLLHTLATLPQHPESVPINALVRIEGTPLAEQTAVSTWELVRMIATARILMPHSIIRLSAGRLEKSQEAQALCFMAGANSIFAGDKLLTTPNPSFAEDEQMFATLGLKPREAFKTNDG